MSVLERLLLEIDKASEPTAMTKDEALGLLIDLRYALADRMEALREEGAEANEYE
jgi:hypothetical protein